MALPKLYEKGITRIEKVNIEFVSALFGRRESDLLFKIQHAGGETYLFLLLEHQTKVDQLMLLRKGLGRGRSGKVRAEL